MLEGSIKSGMKGTSISNTNTLSDRPTTRQWQRHTDSDKNRKGHGKKESVRKRESQIRRDKAEVNSIGGRD